MSRLKVTTQSNVVSDPGQDDTILEAGVFARLVILQSLANAFKKKSFLLICINYIR